MLNDSYGVQAMNNEKKKTISTYLIIKTHQLAKYFISMERLMVLDTSNYDEEEHFTAFKYIPYRIKIRFEGSYYNDVNTTKENKITDIKQVWYEYSTYSGNYGQIEELRWIDDECVISPADKLDNTNFHIIFYNLETKVKEILDIEKRQKQRNIEKKTTYRTLTDYDRSLLKKEEIKLKKLKKTYLRELIGVCKEHLFFIDNRFENKDDDAEILVTPDM